MPQTAGQAPLPNAERERDLLGRLFQGHSTMLTGSAATVPAVLSALPAHQWAHFSCHGIRTSPRRREAACCSRTAFCGSPTSEASITGENSGSFPRARLALAVTLMDEAITLAAALQYVGYRHVVATSWSVYDAAAADVAERVYNRLVSRS
jgi:CHAT domain-containing protein